MSYVGFLTRANPIPTLFGGKGSNLINLIKMGVNVPDGFIVNIKAYNKFLEESPLKNQILRTLSTDYKPKDVLDLSTKIKNLFLETKIPVEIVNEIKRAFYKLRKKFGRKISLSVRSSANIEDLKEFSFAGQAESYLNNNTFEEILESLKNCWISLYSPQSLLYILQMKKNNKIASLKSLRMAVIIQKMVNSQVSGVLFTANVLNNALNQMLINSTWGLGETITNNIIIPDLMILNKDKFAILKNVIGKKEKKSIPNPHGSSTILIGTEQELKSRCSLNQTQLRQLYHLGLKIEKFFDFPQDIEWAIENDVLFTLQSRPITTLSK